MVKVCSYNYPKSREEEYKHYYSKYSYKLHDFQKWCVEAISTGNHVLVCCPTGSGKTFGGEFAIDFFHSAGKKVIYTSPIKALSNEKFYSFTHKYPHINIGLITGDIKTNPDADVLIMTTEILMNKLYQINSSDPNISSSVSFEMDIMNELGCVIFDEIHMINDESRGHVWEQCIMLLPQHIQMVGLSATLDNPERFALWLETKGNATKTVEKEVYLTRKQIRAVPLIHYSFITVPGSINKVIRDKAVQEEIKRVINKPLIIQDDKNAFNDANYQTVQKTLKLFEKYDVKIKRKFVLNSVAEYLVEHEMLPALCYVFSRKQLEICAQEMTANLLEFDSKVPYIVDKECEKIVRKLPNFEEYLHLPEYVNTVALLRKGVGIHHAGLMPILREMTELLFARGFIKILFCTETMSVGINLPVKTTIFTDINKFNGDVVRTLYSHEYTQAAGRAGRLGLDKVGNVIHLNNLFRNVDTSCYKTMMNGKPQTLVSKFKISYNLLLNLLDIGDKNLTQFAGRSMITCNLDDQMKDTYYKMTALETELDNIRNSVQYMRTPQDVLAEYIYLQQQRVIAVNKKRKEVDRKIQELNDSYKHISQDLHSFTKIADKENELVALKTQYDSVNNYLHAGVSRVLELLGEEGFIEGNKDEEHSLKLTIMGRVASQIREVHCLVFALLYEDKKLEHLSAVQLVALFSCFTNIRVLDDFKSNVPKTDDTSSKEIIVDVQNLYNQYKDKELARNINTGFDYEMHFDLLEYVEKWCECSDIESCKLVLQEMASGKQIFLGEFVKALLKINNISCEFEKIAEMTGNIAFLSKLKEIPSITLKYVATNQSLYV
jgi:antiviral helicase SKI2